MLFVCATEVIYPNYFIDRFAVYEANVHEKVYILPQWSTSMHITSLDILNKKL